MTTEPLTLRKLIALVGPEFMDAELTAFVGDGWRNMESVPFPVDLWKMPRIEANAGTGEPARLRFSLVLKRNRLVKVTKS